MVGLLEDIRSYGHLAANMNPLEVNARDNSLLDPEKYGVSEHDLKAVPARVVWKEAPEGIQTALDVMNHLQDIYTSSLAYEFDHVHHMEERKWLNQMVETGSLHRLLSKEERISLLKKLTEVEGFGQFLHRTFVGQK